VNHLDPRPRQRDSLADANPPDEEEAERHTWRKSHDRHSELSAVGKRQEMSCILLNTLIAINFQNLQSGSYLRLHLLCRRVNRDLTHPPANGRSKSARLRYRPLSPANPHRA